MNEDDGLINRRSNVNKESTQNANVLRGAYGVTIENEHDENDKHLVSVYDDDSERTPLLSPHQNRIKALAVPGNDQNLLPESHRATGFSDGPIMESFQAAGPSSDAVQVPPLPEGNDRHLFISHSTEDLEKVMEIVNQLEQRFNVSCIIADRDFQSGKRIFDNIMDSVKRSAKTIFMLTPNFVQSGFCILELEHVLKVSIDCGVSNFFPVLLEECDIPTSLATITYIDCTLPGVDTPAKIVQALAKSGVGEESLLFGEYAIARKFENGYCYSIQSQKVTHCGGCLPATYTFSINDEDIVQLQRAKITIPAEIITEAMNILNTNYLFQPREYRNKCVVYLVLIICVMQVPAALLGLFFGLNMLVIAYVVLAVAILLVVGGIILVACLCRRLRQSGKEDSNMQGQLWTRTREWCLQNNTFIFFEKRHLGYDMPPTLHIMRYNIVECKMYLARLIRSREGEHTEESTSPEERADKQIERAIERMVHLAPSLTGIPDAPYNRHNVKMSRMCLCQLIEAGSPLVN